ncbi:hypothetical protein GLYMA_10G062500v4 [Glycine max]|uniref:Uncharacterized protein n=1 Tax=Glycine max TaxID=3847 RepID=A0A0R0HQ53_SOYBN|nr:hypothetical protein JHK87_026967 [Glycine soja]KAG4996268.1 hypothetical protein JHK85_027707 [Glycine max]KAH1137035.1 hypothetical protein GYH30_027144 [Glycine max]KRH32593.1 hypothetical protein GLYMA_10G062500v4 [Glycine max]
MYTTNSVAAKVPNAVLNDHQLKYENFSTFSLGLKSSNWSAPKVDMLGFSTPLPMATLCVQYEADFRPNMSICKKKRKKL